MHVHSEASLTPIGFDIGLISDKWGFSTYQDLAKQRS